MPEVLANMQKTSGHLASRLAVAIALMFVAPSASLHAAEDGAKPYDSQLLRLSEILGAVHYLRALCGIEEGQIWRERMEGLLDAEGSTPLRRVRFTQSFNRGYRGYQRTYRICNGLAETAMERFLKEGTEITTALAKEYE